MRSVGGDGADTGRTSVGDVEGAGERDGVIEMGVGTRIGMHAHLILPTATDGSRTSSGEAAHGYKTWI